MNTHIARMRTGLIVGLFACLAIPSVAAAAEQTQTATTATESILLSPASKRYELKAGATTQDKLRVVNDGQVGYDFTVYTRPYSVNDESYVPDFTATAQNADAYKWVTFEKTSYRLEPGAFVEVPYSVRVPANATPGGHYGVIFAETQPSADNSGGSVVRKKRVGSILYATIDGDITTAGKSQGLSVPFFQFNAPLKISERVTNSGNTDFVVSSDVRITDLFGGVKHVAQRESTVLPSTTRQIVNDWQSPSWIGLYKVSHSSKFLDSKTSSTSYVLLVPIWVYLTLGLLIGARILYAVVKRKKK